MKSLFDPQQRQASLEEEKVLAQIAYINSHCDGLDSYVSTIPFVGEIEEIGTWPGHSDYEELESDLCEVMIDIVSTSLPSASGGHEHPTV